MIAVGCGRAVGFLGLVQALSVAAVGLGVVLVQALSGSAWQRRLVHVCPTCQRCRPFFRRLVQALSRAWPRHATCPFSTALSGYVFMWL